MTEEAARAEVVRRLLAQAGEALDSAASELHAGRLRFAVNRCYYACFYAVSALFLSEGREFGKHTAVRSAVNRDLVQTGRIEASWGTLYNTLFDARQDGDYEPMTEFTPEVVAAYVDAAAGFVARLRQSISTGGQGGA
jgi:hypothetical protein